jgi:hypothetical protein
MASVCQGHCGSCRRGHEAQRSDGSFGRQAFAISISTLTGSFDALNDLETFTIEQHVLSKLTETGEISLVCLSPVRKTPIASPSS